MSAGLESQVLAAPACRIICQAKLVMIKIEVEM